MVIEVFYLSKESAIVDTLLLLGSAVALTSGVFRSVMKLFPPLSSCDDLRI